MTQPLLDLPRKAAKAAWTRLDRQREAQAWQAVRSLDWQQAYLATQRAERRLGRQLADLNAETGRSSKAQRRQLARVQRQAKALQVPLSSVQAQAKQRRRSQLRQAQQAQQAGAPPEQGDEQR